MTLSFRLVVAAAALALAAAGPVPAQSLYVPRAVKQAFARGTRSPDGRPGRSYWQNRARYSIAVRALPPDRNVRGTEQVTYFNNSPDTLKALAFKLFINIHRPGAIRDDPVAPEYLTAGTTIDAFTVNGQSVRWPTRAIPLTWTPVTLPSPLLPHDSVRMSVDWHYQISLESNREGMIDSTTWFLAYFYPRVAVYDDYNGWDTMDFTDAQEFYSDFNDYDVSVTVPRNYTVWGTVTDTS